MREQWKKYSGFGAVALAVALTVFFVVHYWDSVIHGCGVLAKAITPLLLGAGIAYILNILVSFYERHYFPKSTKPAVRKSARPVCIMGAVLTLIVILLLIVGVIAGELVSYINLIISEVIETVRSFIDTILNFDFMPESIASAIQSVDWAALITGVAGAINFVSSITNPAANVSSTSSFDTNAFTPIAPMIFSLVVAIVFAVCLLAGKERIHTHCERLLAHYTHPTWNAQLHYGVSVTNTCFHDYIVRRCGKTVILGTTCAVCMQILRFPFAMTISVIVGLTALFPIIGACVGAAAGFLLIFSVGAPVKAILFVLILIVLHLLESKVIYPRLIKSSTGLSFTWTFAAVAVGAGIWGFTGLLLGVPVATTIWQLLRNDMSQKETKV